ncbi:MAG TPA: GNAT family N-acetyltransferase [Nanoarchaeota archaeon]|nr:GNAT family N-acetyltransferase [Nanoarchaeota archaeon]
MEQIIRVYKSAFAETPWDEYRKCSQCGANYGIEEAKQVYAAIETAICKKCGRGLWRNFCEFWSAEEIITDLESALKKESPVALVAEAGPIAGFTWGYNLPQGQFPFLEGKIAQPTIYMGEMAVGGNARKKGIGFSLGKKFLDEIAARGFRFSVVRTDINNPASMGLFEKLGYRKTGIFDPDYPSRVYMEARL